VIRFLYIDMSDQPIDHLRKIRLTKLERLRKEGVDPYPARTGPVISATEARKREGKAAAVAGRLMAVRFQGKIAFADVRDGSGKIQIFLSEENLRDTYRQFVDLFDIGDFVRAEGEVFKTRAGELSIRAKKVTMLAKSLRPLPEKWHGLKDVEERYRQRYLDLIANPEVKDVFLARTKTIDAIRNFLNHHGFLEVETPVLQPIPGGASAKPFITHYNAYDTDVYLRIAPELYLKRLLVGDMERVYEFAKSFRNEGVDSTHNPEFTNLEFYWAFTDYETLMDFTEDLIIAVVKEVLGEPIIVRDGKRIALKKPFRRVTFHEATKGKNTDEALKAYVKGETGPAFVVDHPIDISPLAKRKDSQHVERFQLIIGGLEIVNAFSELNDPVEQRQRFEEQEKARAKGDEEAQRLDEDFLTALEYGLPPAGGWGMGVDRFILLVTGKHALRETILFPFMRSKRSIANTYLKEGI
jgi:lysyl-tRNA synthetase class 2